MACFVCLEENLENQTELSLILDEDTLIPCKGHHAHAFCLRRWLVISFDTSDQNTKLTCTLCKRFYTDRERDKISAFTGKLKKLITNIEFCKNDRIMTMLVDCRIELPFDMYLKSVVWAVENNDKFFMQRLKAFQKYIWYYYVEEKRMVTAAVYKLTSQVQISLASK